MLKRKQGENEAINILVNLGIEIDREYYDDNSRNSMPDIKCKDGHYIEVTHTLHNNALIKSVSNYYKLLPGEDWSSYNQRHQRVEKECSQALHRISKMDYEKDLLFRLTIAGKIQFKKDIKLVKEHMGYDFSEADMNKRQSEFKCDCPTFLFSVDNILRELNKDKGTKYSEGNVDLFIFVTEDEFRLMKDLIHQMNWNGVARGFLNQILYSPFPRLYVCEWDFESQKYNTSNPKLVIFYNSNDRLEWKWHNI